MANTNILPSTKYRNNFRTVSGTVIVNDDDVILLCNTSSAPVTIELALIPADYFSTQYKLYIKDNSGNASVNNITINVPVGYKINGQTSQTISTNGQAVTIFIESNVDYGMSMNSSSAVSGHVIQYQGTPFAQRAALNFIGSKVSVTDDSVNNRTSVTYDSSINVKNTVFVMKNGNDSTGLVERFDLPFLTIAAARAALLAFYTGGNAPSATNRILVETYSGNYPETIILDNFVDYNLRDCVITNTVANNSVITDNNVAVNSIVYGQANLVSTTSAGTGTNAVYIQNASSNVTITVNDITVTGTSSSVIRGIRSVGTLYINFNNLTVTESSGNTIGIFSDTGTIFATAKGNVTTTSSSLHNSIACVGSPALLYFNGNNRSCINSSNALAINAISAQTGGKAWIRCNNIYHSGTGSSSVGCGAVFCGVGTATELHLFCNEILVTTASSNDVSVCRVGRSESLETLSGIMTVECTKAVIVAEGAANRAVVMEHCYVNTVATFTGKYEVQDGGGTNVDCVDIETNGLGQLIIKDSTLVAIGTGDALTSSVAANVRIYGSCQSNKAVNVNVTLLVGTVLNGRFIENDANVI